MMDKKTYQMIFEEIYVFLPNDWEKVVVYLEHGEAAYSYSFFVKCDGRYIKCFELENVLEDDLFAAFTRIEAKVSDERRKLKDCWSNMTMVVDNEGTMKTEFDYTDLSVGAYQYKKLWKKRFLQ